MMPYITWTDAAIYSVLLIFGGWIFLNKHSPQMQNLGNKILSQPRYLISVVVLIFFCWIGLLDSIHFVSGPNSDIVSILDIILSPVSQHNERTYSAPLAVHSYVPEFVKTELGKLMEVYPPLEYAGRNFIYSQDKNLDILFHIGKGLVQGIGITLLLYMFFRRLVIKTIRGVHSQYRILSVWLTLGIILSLLGICFNLMNDYHILGTDKVGRDVFYIAIKSIRTGLVIGILTTLIMLPFALILGTWAGYFRGIVDDVIQYIYITLSSIPAILLIAAAVLSFQVKIEGNPDLKLLILCLILGITSWTSLCRLLRGEALKLRDSEYVQAAITLGVSHFTILRRHILPNLMHIVIITLVLDFSSLVLSEAVLTYVGVGVDANTYSFGNMINAARLEMVRDPMVWWSLTCAFCLMFIMVFSANIFSEAVQQAMNPREE